MININQRISLSKKSKRTIKKFLIKNGQLSTSSWDEINKKVKNEISKKLLSTHFLNCAYCEGSLIIQGNQIDHFSPKSVTPEFSFNPTNLFYICGHCNSKARKGDKPTINSPVKKNYSENEFKIVHPYFDNTDNEIVFTDNDRIFFDWDTCSLKGIYTIWFFKWADPRMTQIRNMNAMIRKNSSNNSFNDKILINSIISYKNK
ncbi:MAG: hypothetical protein RJA07_1830 [Bacteroidota bacterium]|jgi:uncharacterized protein (TIGR02646 family)